MVFILLLLIKEKLSTTIKLFSTYKFFQNGKIASNRIKIECLTSKFLEKTRAERESIELKGKETIRWQKQAQMSIFQFKRNSFNYAFKI